MIFIFSSVWWSWDVNRVIETECDSASDCRTFHLDQSGGPVNQPLTPAIGSLYCLALSRPTRGLVRTPLQSNPSRGDYVPKVSSL